jgi:hypothetical protein
MRLVLCSLALVGALIAGDLKLGKPLALKETIAIDTLMAQPADYVGKAVQVKGKIAEVCENMGCWMNLVSDSGKSVRIKVKDGEIVFPKESAGKMAVAEGQFAKIEMTKEQAIAQARHEAEENKKKFDPASITSGKTIYQIQGSGAVILAN